MPCWKNSILALALLMSGCAEPVPARARIEAARTVPGPEGPALELTQQLQFSEAMREALDHGIALRLVYDIRLCGQAQQHALWLRHAPLSRRYELQREGDDEVRGFARQSALFAALDRVRLPLAQSPDSACAGRVRLWLDLAGLPTPLRFPAFAEPEQWRLQSPPHVWSTP